MSPDLEAWHDLGEPKAPPAMVLSLWRGVIPVVRSAPTVAVIQETVAAYYGMTRRELISERRARAIARPRQIAMWLTKKLTVRSLPDIGQRFGGRDHTTVLHAVRRIEALRAEDPAIGNACDVLIEQLGGMPA